MRERYRGRMLTPRLRSGALPPLVWRTSDGPVGTMHELHARRLPRQRRRANRACAPREPTTIRSCVAHARAISADAPGGRCPRRISVSRLDRLPVRRSAAALDATYVSAPAAGS